MRLRGTQLNSLDSAQANATVAGWEPLCHEVYLVRWSFLRNKINHNSISFPKYSHRLSVLTNTSSTTLGFHLKTRTYFRVVNSALSSYKQRILCFPNFHHCDTCALSRGVGGHQKISASLRTSSLAFIPTEPRFTVVSEVVLCVSGAEA